MQSYNPVVCRYKLPKDDYEVGTIDWISICFYHQGCFGNFCKTWFFWCTGVGGRLHLKEVTGKEMMKMISQTMLSTCWLYTVVDFWLQVEGISERKNSRYKD